MDKKDIIFAPNVLLLDAAFLNGTVRDIKLLMGNKLGRELPDTDLVDWLICLALDGGLRGESNELQVLWVADEGVRQMPGCIPSALEELDGQACQTPIGEFSFSVVPSAGLVSRADLFAELMKLALDAKEVKRLLLVPDFYEYGEKLAKTLHDFNTESDEDDALGKVLCFLLEERDGGFPCSIDLITYSLMHIWGIAPDDL